MARIVPKNWRSVKLKSGKLFDPASLAEPLSRLNLSGNRDVEALPDGVASGVIDAAGCVSLKTIGAGVRCNELIIDGSAVDTIPDDIIVEFRFSARDCQRLRRLPAGLKPHVLNLRGCVALEELPAGLSLAYLDLGGCSAIRALPAGLELRGGVLSLRDCPLIADLAPASGVVAGLDLSGCRNIDAIPDGLDVTSWIDVAGSGFTELPARLADLAVRWRGVSVNARVAFRPDTLSVDEILAERNAEVRRVMVERFGFERFMAEAKAEVLDKDRDAGGERQLLKVPLENDEDIVCVSVFCPSTGGRFFLRVPPNMTSCRAAVAWTAGFDSVDDYAPRVET